VWVTLTGTSLIEFTEHQSSQFIFQNLRDVSLGYYLVVIPPIFTIVLIFVVFIEGKLKYCKEYSIHWNQCICCTMCVLLFLL